MAETVVVGGGCSGVLTALQLLDRATDDVLLIDPGYRPGRGLPYRTEYPGHVLNSRAGSMSAWPDRPDDFVAWCNRNGHPIAPTGFAPRHLFGSYLEASLESAGAGRLTHLACTVTQLAAGVLRLANGTVLTADRIVLALGSAEPCVLASVPAHLRRDRRYVGQPWTDGALDIAPGDRPVLLVGTGLTAVDVALSLATRGVRTLAVSRHGLLPRAHVEQVGTPPVGPLPAPAPLRHLLRSVRALIRSTGDWRAAVDALRPELDRYWTALPLVEQEAFLRHAARYWEIHRHRMAPTVAAAVQELLVDGTLTVRSGRLSALDDDFVATVDGARIPVAAVVNCTGPGVPATIPLVAALLRDGVARPGPHGLGLDVGPAGELLDAGGAVVRGVHVVGPLRRGRYWETTAVPEIRAQAAAVAVTPDRRARSGSLPGR